MVSVFNIHAAVFILVFFALFVMATVGGGGGEKVKDILSDQEFQKELVVAESRLVIVNFSASWYARVRFK